MGRSNPGALLFLYGNIAMDIATAARRLGGEAFGSQINCPGPGHSPRDRSLSVKFNSNGSYVVHSHSGDEWIDCRDHVRSLLGETLAPQPLRIILPHENEQNLHRARHLWSCRKPVAGSVVEAYLLARGCSLPASDSIGYLETGAYPYPAMIAAFGEPDEPRGIHLTFLKPDGSGKADIERPKIMMGPSCSFPIVIAQPNDLLGLAITEGIEDAISVHEFHRLGCVGGRVSEPHGRSRHQGPWIYRNRNHPRSQRQGW